MLLLRKMILRMSTERNYRSKLQKTQMTTKTKKRRRKRSKKTKTISYKLMSVTKKMMTKMEKIS